MKRKTLTKIMAFILSGAMMIGQSGTALAAEDSPLPETVLSGDTQTDDEESANEYSSADSASSSESESTDPSDETDDESENITDSSSEDATDTDNDNKEIVDDTEKSEASSDEKSDDESEETSEDESGTEDSAELPDNEEDAELPEGVNGMPEGYVLSPEEEEAKRELLSHNVLDNFDDLVPGVNYVENEVICMADSREHAQQIAEAYSAELKDYSYGVAVIDLSDSPLDVASAFAYALDSGLDLPAVEPNYTMQLIEPELTGSVSSPKLFGASPNDGSQYWQTWEMVYESLEHPDPFLNPSNSENPAYYQWHLQYINAYAAWAVTKGSSSITVAVIDTGCADHPDFGDNFIAPSGLVTYDTDEDGNEIFYNNHGTHVCGIIGAELGNGKGGSGVAPGATIMPINAYTQMLDDQGKPIVDERGYPVCSFTNENLSKAIMYVAGYNDGDENPGAPRADIVSMSLGGSEYSNVVDTAAQIAYSKGVTLVAAMGNESGSVMSYPACYDHVISVAATSFDGRPTDFSNTGSWADIAAPGDTIYSTVFDNGYEPMSGTSQATPIVSAACALYMSAFGHVDPDEMESALKRAADPVSYSGAGAGIINLAKLFNGDTTAPTISVTAPYEEVPDQTYSWTSHNGNSTTAEYPFPVATSKVTITAAGFNGDRAANESTTLVYTTDGTNPSFTNGTSYEGPINVSDIKNDADENNIITVKALAITGMGVISGYTTLKFRIEDPPVSKPSVEIFGAPMKNNTPGTITLLAGKSLTLSAAVYDNTDENNRFPTGEKVTWAISSYYDGDLSKATINGSTGKLTTKAGQTGKLVVTCTAVNSKVSSSVIIDVVSSVSLLKTLTLDTSSLSLPYVCSDEREGYKFESIEIKKLVDAKNNILYDATAPDSYSGWQNVGFSWTSSNNAVVKVESVPSADGKSPNSCNVIAVGAGSAKVTCLALDGSGKKAVVTVKVTCPPDKKTASIALGCVKGGAPQEDPLTLYKGVPEGVSEEALADVAGLWCRVTALDSTTTDVGYCCIPVTFKSSNTKVASLSLDEATGTWYVHAEGKGTAKITATAKDGSGKKAELKVTVKQLVTGMTITGQDYIAPGASAVYKLATTPSNADNKNVTWKILEEDETTPADPSVISFDQGKKKVTVSENAHAGEKYYLAAISEDEGGFALAKSIDIINKATAVSVKNASTYQDLPASISLAKAPEGSEREGYSYCNMYGFADNGAWLSVTSSNEKIVSVTETGFNEGRTSCTLTATGKGTAKVTVAATDGSGLKKTITVKVTIPVSEIRISGPQYALKGATTTYKASAILPKDAANKKVNWEVGTVAPGDSEVFTPGVEGLTIKDGKLTVSKDAVPPENPIAIRAAATDGSKVTSELFYIDLTDSKTTGITTDIYDIDDETYPTRDEDRECYKVVYKKTLSSLQLFTVKTGRNEIDERTIKVVASVTGSENFVGWTTGNKDIVDVECYSDEKFSYPNVAVLTAKSPGTTTITCAAQDGSEKKTSFKVTVITPVSDINVRISGNNAEFIAYGKSASLTATPGNTYGKPTNPKIKWDYEIWRTDNAGTFEYGEGDGGIMPLTDANLAEKVKKDKKLFAFSNGKVTINANYYKNRMNYPGEYKTGKEEPATFVIKAIATATDGSGASGYKYIYPVKKAENFNYYRFVSNDSLSRIRSVQLSLKDYYPFTVYEPDDPDTRLPQSEPVYVFHTYYAEDAQAVVPGYSGQTDEFSDGSDYEKMLNRYYYITSSNDKVATAFLSDSSLTSSGKDCPVLRLDIYPHSTGTTKITLTAKDGSGLSKTITVKVVD